MEWSDFLESSFCTNLQALQTTHPGWDYEENKMFETALAQLGFATPDLLQKVAARVPGKSFEQVVSHFAALVQDIEMIESAGDFPMSMPELGTKKEQGSSARAMSTGHTSRRGFHGLYKNITFGKGDWRNISRHCVITKSPTQVASHAQKYFKRHSSSASSSARRRRCSIHDIQINFDDDSTSTILPNISQISDASRLLPSSCNNGEEKNLISPR
ncbi:Transcription factor DIVARICATA [Vitis vinifera]|uniref:Transcription factor DIVARICATA n=1 Tax=Vitis vinifera TaxID=29760 RepID=A0A438KKC7_VITVI|nr:Transcription factor DIVARICATA [Vitis vinifera]